MTRLLVLNNSTCNPLDRSVPATRTKPDRRSCSHDEFFESHCTNLMISVGTVSRTVFDDVGPSPSMVCRVCGVAWHLGRWPDGRRTSREIVSLCLVIVTRFSFSANVCRGMLVFRSSAISMSCSQMPLTSSFHCLAFNSTISCTRFPIRSRSDSGPKTTASRRTVATRPRASADVIAAPAGTPSTSVARTAIALQNGWEEGHLDGDRGYNG